MDFMNSVGVLLPMELWGASERLAFYLGVGHDKNQF